VNIRVGIGYALLLLRVFRVLAENATVPTLLKGKIHMKAWKIVIAIYLILVGLMALIPGVMVSFPFYVVITGLLAIVGAVLLLVDK